MYYIIHKNKDGVYLLDDSQQLLWKDQDLHASISKWKSLKQDYENNGNLYLVSAEKDTKEKQLLTVVRHY